MALPPLFRFGIPDILTHNPSRLIHKFKSPNIVRTRSHAEPAEQIGVRDGAPTICPFLHDPCLAGLSHETPPMKENNENITFGIL